MATTENLFTLVDTHLLQDELPSIYLDKLSSLSEFNKYPFSMLLRLKKAEQNPKHHPEGNVWNHTMMVVDIAAKQKERSTDPQIFMWAMLLHDIGKPAATMIRKGKLTAYDHDKIGEKLSRDFLSALGVSDVFLEQVTALVRYHMHPLFIVKNMPYVDLKGLLARTNIDDLALLSLCDRLGRTGANSKNEKENTRLFLSKVKNLQNAMRNTSR